MGQRAAYAERLQPYGWCLGTGTRSRQSDAGSVADGKAANKAACGFRSYRVAADARRRVRPGRLPRGARRAAAALYFFLFARARDSSAGTL